MKAYNIYLFFVLAILMNCPNMAFGQSTTQGKTTTVELSKQANGFYQSTTLEVGLENVKPFLAYAVAWKNSSDVHHVPLQIRFSENGQAWKAWQSIEEGSHTNQELLLTIGELMYADNNSRYYQIKLEQTNPLQQLQVRFFNPGETTKIDANRVEESAITSQTCPCPLPEVQSREMWCPAGNCPPNPSPTETIPTHLIVHHSAGSNTSNDWAATVRSIWDYHVNSNGWSDIGYNYLVDPNGVVYEGRGNNVLGAHFCGMNTKTMGTCVMGDFTNITPTEEAKMGLIRLLAWKVCDRNMNPLDTVFHSASGGPLPRISGHRDGCATACPGDSFYPLLPEIRQGVADFIENNCEFVVSNIATIFNDATVQIFPNPTTDQIDIQVENDWRGRMQLEVSTIDGKILQQQIVAKDTQVSKTMFDLKSYQTGIYLLNIKTEEGQKSWKVMVN